MFEFILSRSSEMKEPFPGKELEISEINTLSLKSCYTSKLPLFLS